MSQINNPQPNQQPSNSSSGVQDVALQSSFMQRAVYDPSSLRLTLYFKSGKEITHLFVFPTVWAAFLQAPSKGSFYAKMIKGQTQSINVNKPLMPSDINKSKPKRFK